MCQLRFRIIGGFFKFICLSCARTFVFVSVCVLEFRVNDYTSCDVIVIRDCFGRWLYVFQLSVLDFFLLTFGMRMLKLCFSLRFLLFLCFFKLFFWMCSAYMLGGWGSISMQIQGTSLCLPFFSLITFSFQAVLSVLPLDKQKCHVRNPSKS